MLCKKVCSDILPQFGTDILLRPLSPHAYLLARQQPAKEAQHDVLKDPDGQKNAHKKPGTPPQSPSSPITKRAASSRKVIEARASAQCAKLDAQVEWEAPMRTAPSSPRRACRSPRMGP